VGPYVVQFGDQLSRDMTKKDQWGKGGSGPRQGVRPLGVNEINKRQFVRGVVGMAHQPWEDPEAGDCQLFIVKVANPALNGKYVAIGRVAKGMDVVDKLEVEDVIKDVSVK
jgi:cyclophilin family peptidyl-prolyl cis-trans isomerase